MHRSEQRVHVGQVQRVVEELELQALDAVRGVDSSERLGRPRWVAERTLGWFARFRRLTVRYLAAGMPNVDSELGTPTGPYFAYGIGSARRAARFDLHYGPERLNTPGLITVTAEPGGGKSVLIGSLAYNAVRCGERTIVFDPSGPLARLCRLPELAPFSRELDLTTSPAGTLSPAIASKPGVGEP